MLVVFLNNKLITADTIAPLVFEFSERHPTEAIEIVCFGGRTFDIIKRNPVIYDVFKSCGRLYPLGGDSSNRAVRIITGALRLLRLAWFALLKRATFVHFKALNDFPLRILYLLNPERTFFCQGSNRYFSDAHLAALKVLEPRKFSAPVPAARHLIGFDERWWPFKDDRLQNYDRRLVSAPYRRARWHNHLRDSAAMFLRDVAIDQDVRYFIMVLSTMDAAELLADVDGYPALFAETLRILASEVPHTPVLIKRHPAMNREFAVLAERLVRDSDHRNAHFVNLHPMVLAPRALAMIANSYSSTFDFAHHMGVPTIEFTHYSAKALAATGGGSISPATVSHFVQDADRFRSVLADIVAQSEQRRAPATDLGENYDSLLDLLAAPNAAHASQ